MTIPFEVLPQGLYCRKGDFFIDATRPVSTCVVTHAHGDHAYRGHRHYIASSSSLKILLHRLGKVAIQTLDYGEKIKLGNCWVSLHPSGHILGASQVRIEIDQKVYVVSGDYKRAPDPTCLPFEPIDCDLFITETTFALPIYHWKNPQIIAEEMYHWWQTNAEHDHPSVLFCYSLGKAQRILAMLKNFTERPIYLHGAIMPLARIYKEEGAPLAPFLSVGEKKKGESFAKELILAPPSAAGSAWLKRFPSFRTAAASGWMQVRGMKRRKGMDHGFILSDHADWDDLLLTIKQTKASTILTTHGNTHVLAQFLKEEWNLHASELRGLESIIEED